MPQPITCRAPILALLAPLLLIPACASQPDATPAASPEIHHEDNVDISDECGRVTTIPKRTRDACLKSLYEIAAGFEELRPQYTNILDALAPASIDARELSAHFAIRDPHREFAANPVRGRILPLPKHSGLYIAYDTIRTGERKIENAYQCYCPFINLRCEWSWMWVGDRPRNVQAALAALIRKSVRPIVELEAALADQVLATPGDLPDWIITDGPIELTLRPDPEHSKPDALIFYLDVKNNTPDSVTVDALGPWEVFLDGYLQVEHILNELTEPRLAYGQPNFIRIAPGESKAAGMIILPAPPPGSHKLRVLKGYLRDHLLDLRPMACDGPPTWRRVDNAWTGYVLSEEMNIEG